ncbi:MAG: hypothetical protein K1X57_13780 [Gemmataceae bacterium]|nr:hypothetical protein [Gemmataceae bacterium]
MTYGRRTFRRLLNLERFEQRLTPATYVVDDLSFNGFGNSLRALVNTANNNPGADTITFQPGLSGTITFNAADDMDINGPLTIIGPGSGVITVNAAGLSRIFDTSVSPAGTIISISGLTLAGGRAKYVAPGNGPDISGVGGAIYVENEDVSLFDCKVTGNVADKSGGGIGIGEHAYLGFGVGASVTVQSSSISGNVANGGGGGGISAYGESFDQYASRYQSLYVENTVISGNSCNSSDSINLSGGGGISFRGKVGSGGFSLVNSSITDNRAFAFASGGGIWAGDLQGTLSLLNSTVAYNKSDVPIAGGFRFQDRFNHSGAGKLSIHSSIVANNTSVDDTTKRDFSSVFLLPAAINWSLVGISDQGNLSITGSNNKLGTAAVPLDSKLGPLANNGGPGMTRMPLSNSPAVGNGSNGFGFSTDGRGIGYPRILDGSIDIGAVEFTDWVVRNANDKGAGSLSQRIADANQFVGVQTITFDPVQFASPQKIKASGNTPISDGLTVVGPGNLTITIGGSVRMFDARLAPVGSVVSFSGMSFESGSVVGLGGVFIAKNQTLNFTDCTFTKNQATAGGAIGFETGTSNALNLLRCSFDENSAVNTGGAVYFESGGQFSIDDCSFLSNGTGAGSSALGGGAIAFAGTAPSPLLILNSTFNNNKSPGQGGAVYLSSFTGTVNSTDCTFANNQATDGGGISFENGTSKILNLLRCTFDANSATNLGGAVYFENGGQFAIDDSTFSGNATATGTALTQGGGAIAFVGTASTPLQVRNSTFANNKSAGQGGAIFLTSFAGTLNVPNSTIAYNSAAGSAGGGGIARTASTGTITLDSTILTSNTNSGGIHPDIFSTGTVTATVSAIGNPGNTLLTADATTSGLLGQNVRLGILGAYGGTTLTIPLLPGSPAANKGKAGGLTSDQRGLSRSLGGAADIGAFEGQGFIISVVSGSPQSTVTNTAFSTLVAGIVAVNAVEPVNGGVIMFTAPPSGASATLSSLVALIASGSASTTATANALVGSYNVNAAAGSSSVDFVLTNLVQESPSLIVTTASDIADSFDFKTSLREAVAFANLKSGHDTITFDAVVFATPQTLILTSGELALNDAVTITGPGSGLTTISANKVGRIFNTAAAVSGTSVNISGLTLTGGQTLLRGGAIFGKDQVLTLTDCVLTGNSAGAGGAVAFDITAAGRLVLQRTTVSNNTASFGGGGIYFFGGGSFLIQNSTLSGNKSNSTNISNGGGGVYFNGAGGSKLLEIRNSTLSGNTAVSDGGGLCIRNHAGSLYMVNSTVANNIASGTQGGGGIAQVASTSVWSVGSCIISNNTHTAGSAEDLYNPATGFAGSLDSCAIGTTFGTSGLTLNLTTQTLLGQNFLLAPLGSFGGPTQSHALMAGSPAIDKGTNLIGLTTDQRGLARVSGGAPDIGAFETQPLVVTTTNDVSNGDLRLADLSLREALTIANGVSGPDTITFDPVVFASPQTITLGSTLSVTDALTINGPGANKVTLSGNNAVRVMAIDTPSSGQKITVSGLKIANGFSAQGGGVFIGDESVVLQNCAIVNNLASSQIGALFVALGANVVLEGCTVSGNSAPNTGAIYSASPLTIRASTIASNSATVSASGGIRIGGLGSLVLESSTVVGNTAVTNGGGILAVAAVSATNTVISGNAIGSGESDFTSTNTSSVLTATSSAVGSISGPGAISDKGGNIFNQPHTNLKLGSLANNGGPTQTIALLPGSPLINAGSNPAILTTDQRGAGFLRIVGTAADIGAFEKQDVPRGIIGVVVNGGSAQRSRVTSMKVNFDQPLTLPTNPADAFQLIRQSDNAVVTLNASVVGNVVTLTFTGGPVEFGSLADGRYTLTALASKITNFDGNGDAVAGDNFVLTGSPANGLFRLFGDGDGSGQVDSSDFLAFRLAFLTNSSTFDSDNSGQVDSADFLRFRLNFLKAI